MVAQNFFFLRQFLCSRDIDTLRRRLLPCSCRSTVVPSRRVATRQPAAGKQASRRSSSPRWHASKQDYLLYLSLVLSLPQVKVSAIRDKCYVKNMKVSQSGTSIATKWLSRIIMFTIERYYSQRCTTHDASLYTVKFFWYTAGEETKLLRFLPLFNRDQGR